MTTEEQIRLATDLAAINGILLEQPNQPLELIHRIGVLVTKASHIAETITVQDSVVLDAILTRNGV